MTTTPRRTWRPLVAQRSCPQRPPCTPRLVLSQLWDATERGLCTAVLVMNGADRDMAVGGGGAAGHARSW